MNLKPHRSLLTLAALAALSALGACGQQDASITPQASADAKPQTNVMGAPPAQPSPQDVAVASPLGERINDAQIVSGIKAQFAGDKDISPMAIEVDSKEGMVTLSGVVTNTEAKVRADQIAKQMKDVKSVNNQLEVKAG